jgi:hypothetical protein
MRRFWWRRLPRGEYDVSSVSCLAMALVAFSSALSLLGYSRFSGVFFCWGDVGFPLQLYAAHASEVLIGLYRKHQPPEVLSIGDNYATFYFRFSHEPLLLHALLALSLNRWIDCQAAASQIT